MYYFDSTIPYLYKAGIRRYFFEILNTFSSLNKAKSLFNQSKIITPDNFEELDSVITGNHFELVRLGYPPKIPLFHRLIYYQYYFRAIVNLKDNDKLFSPYFQLPGKYKGPNVISTIHDMLYFDMKHLYNSPAEKFYVNYYNYKLSESIKNRHTILTVSDYSRTRISNYFDLDENDVMVFYNFLSGTYYNSLIDTNQKRGLIEAKFKFPYFLYTAGWETRKNSEVLLRAINNYLSGNSVEKFHFVFTGINQELLFKMFKNFKLTIKNFDYLHAVGFINSLDLSNLYHNAQAILNLSSYEGFGFPILESILAGKNIICSDIPPFREIAQKFPLYVNYKNIDEIVDALNFIVSLNNNSNYFNPVKVDYGINLNNAYQEKNISTLKTLFFD